MLAPAERIQTRKDQLDANVLTQHVGMAAVGAQYRLASHCRASCPAPEHVQQLTAGAVLIGRSCANGGSTSNGGRSQPLPAER